MPKQTRDMDANAAVSEITEEQLQSPKISVSRADARCYLFFGGSPRAQLSIPIENPMAVNIAELDSLRQTFPHAQITFQ